MSPSLKTRIDGYPREVWINEAGDELIEKYTITNMLLSGIGAPYDPVEQKGVIGKNYCYQTGAGATLFFEGKYFNPFMNAGGSNATIDDFNVNWAFDRAPHNFVGAYNVAGGFNTVLPIGYRPVPSGTPQWGREWKKATAKWYQTAMVINASGSVMANRYNCYDLDPTYRNAFGQPLMRMRARETARSTSPPSRLPTRSSTSRSRW